MSERAKCSACGAMVRLTAAGNLAQHAYTLTVSRKAIHSLGKGRVRQPCPGGGRPPREVER